MADRGEAVGLATALAVLGAAGDGPAADCEADLFEADAPLPLPLRAASGPKGGRPKGARNRSTDEWIKYFLSQRRAPLTVLGELYSRPVSEIVEELQRIADKQWREEGEDGVRRAHVTINPLDVLKLQRDCAAALLPYIHKQQPKALEIEERKRGVVLIGELEEAEAIEENELALPLPKSVKNHEVGETARGQSENDQSETSGKVSQDNPLAYNGD